jgi:hypothetical protein
MGPGADPGSRTRTACPSTMTSARGGATSTRPAVSGIPSVANRTGNVVSLASSCGNGLSRVGDMCWATT